MANKEISKQIAERRGRIAMGLQSSTDFQFFLQPPTLEEENRLKKRWTPKVKAAMTTSAEYIQRGIETGDKMLAYASTVDYTLASIYGEAGINVINWEVQPVIGIPEQRYLVVMNNIGLSVAEERYTDTQQILEGLTSYYGSNADSGGFPCNPEILISLMNTEGYLQSIFQVAPFASEDSKWAGRIGEEILGLSHSFACQDRFEVLESMTRLDERTNEYFKQKKFERKISAVHPLLGQLANRVYGLIK